MERSVNAIKIHPQIFLLHTTTWYCTYYFTDLIKPSSFQVQVGQFLRFERELKQIRSSVGRTRPLRLCHPLMVLEVHGQEVSERSTETCESI